MYCAIRIQYFRSQTFEKYELKVAIFAYQQDFSKAFTCLGDILNFFLICKIKVNQLLRTASKSIFEFSNFEFNYLWVNVLGFLVPLRFNLLNCQNS